MNSTLERILNNFQAKIVKNGKEISIGFFQSHWELSTPMMLDVELAYAEKIVKNLAAINSITCPEKITLHVDPVTLTIHLKQTVFIPSDLSFFEQSLATFLDIAKEWEEILTTSASL